MVGADRPAIRRLVAQGNGWGLVPEFEHARVVLPGVHRGQFVGMAFRLDHDSHLAAGIAAGHATLTALHPPGWGGSADMPDYLPGLFRQPARAHKLLKCFVV